MQLDGGGTNRTVAGSLRKTVSPLNKSLREKGLGRDGMAEDVPAEGHKK